MRERCLFVRHSEDPNVAVFLREKLSQFIGPHGHTLLLCPRAEVERTRNYTVLAPPEGMDVGSYQKLGIQFAIEQGFQIVCLLEPEHDSDPVDIIDKLEEIRSKPDIAALYASRKKEKTYSLLRIGRSILRRVHNFLVGVPLQDLHSAFRFYRLSFLNKLPFEQNSDGRLFLVELTIQHVIAGFRIEETSSTELYPKHKPSFSYGWSILRLSILQRVQRLGILYDTRFDLTPENLHYVSKFDFPSSHSFALEAVPNGGKLLILGSGPADLVKPFKTRTTRITALDQYVAPDLKYVCNDARACNLDDVKDFDELKSDEPYAAVLALDIIEHLRSPENFLTALRESLCTTGAKVVITTPNIGFLPIRLMLLLGQFNYGKRGILDRTHTRLFTFRSMRKLLEQEGFRVISEKGVPAPFPLAIGRGSIADALLAFNLALIQLMRGMFSFQIYVEAVPLPTVKQLLRQAEGRVEVNRREALL